MSLYDGISVETAPLSAVIGSSNSSNESKADNSNISKSLMGSDVLLIGPFGALG